MFACICRAVTSDRVSTAIDNGAARVEAVSKATGACTGCGTCRERIEGLAVETEAVGRLRRGIEYMRGMGDVTSANIFEATLSDEEEHIDYLETQLGLVSQLGEQLYLAQRVEQPDG